MTSRERVLVIIFLGCLLPIGGWAGFHVLFWKPYSALRSRLETAQKEIAAKADEKAAIDADIRQASELDPRLTRWEIDSLPDTSSRDQDKIKSHVAQVGGEYQHEMEELLRRNHFQSPAGTPNINMQALTKPPGDKPVPQLANKVPLYTRVAFKFKARSTYENLVKMLREFYQQDKLHQIYEITVTNPTPPSTGGRGTSGRGATGRGFGVPVVPGGALEPGVAEAGGRGGRDSTLLDVEMTIEVLMVNGALTIEARQKIAEKPHGVPDKGGPKNAGKDKVAVRRGGDGEEQEEADVKVPVTPRSVSILAPKRNYLDMVYKSMYTGIASSKKQDSKGQEDPSVVMKSVKLVMVEKAASPASILFVFGPAIAATRITEKNADPVAEWIAHPYVWTAEFYDQGAAKSKDRYYRFNADFLNENSFEIRDKYDNVVLSGTVVDANIYGIVIKVEDAYYKMRLDDFLDDVLNPPVNKKTGASDPERDPLQRYKRGDWKGPTFTASLAQLSDAPADILKDVKLTRSADSGRRWEVEFTDALRKKDYSCTPDFESRSNFEVKNRKGIVVVKGRVVDGNALGVVIKVEDLFYKMKLGDSFDNVLNPARDGAKRVLDAERESLKEYKRGDWKMPAPPPMSEKEQKGEEKKDEGK